MQDFKRLAYHTCQRLQVWVHPLIILQIYARQVAARMRSNTTTSTPGLQAYGNLYFSEMNYRSRGPRNR
jgi:hypothetical protein